MKVLFIGDLYGKAGVDALIEALPELKQTYQPNIIIANAENAANGRGISLSIYKELMRAGVHALTMGNWVWGHKDLFEFIDESKVVRPVNFAHAPGKGFLTINYNGQKLLVINALGRTFMNPNLNDPFVTIEQVLKQETYDYSLVDIHAEATSEKVALGHYLDGLASAVVGTHTHVPTADARILPRGTLYQTDVGMTGPLNGVIGVDRDIVINRFINGYSIPNEVAKGMRQINAVLLDLKLKRIQSIHLELQ